MLAQFGLVAQWPLPSLIAWVVIAAAGAATVLSFAILGEYYPREISGRANAALNLLHIGGAFVLQLATGSIIALWPQSQGAYPTEAHQAAMGTMLLLQLVALLGELGIGGLGRVRGFGRVRRRRRQLGLDLSLQSL